MFFRSSTLKPPVGISASHDTLRTFARAEDTLAEWLRRRPAKPVGSAREGSNPSGVDFFTLGAVQAFLVLEFSGVVVGDLAQMVERSLSMREALGSMPRFSIFHFLRIFSCMQKSQWPGSNRRPPAY